VANDGNYIVGLDLGQAHAPSALCVLQRSVASEPGSRARATRFACPWLKRWPLGTSYVTIGDDVEDLVAKPPLRGCDLVIDATGVGRPVYDLFKEKRLPANLHGVIITAGIAETKPAGQPFFHVAKVILISTVQVALQQRRMQFAASLPEVPTLVKEFQDYRVKITAAQNEVYNAREGANDDLLLAVSLAAWYGERHPPWQGFSPYRCGTGGFNPNVIPGVARFRAQGWHNGKWQFAGDRNY
jgi:hypothetical protein